MPRRNPHAKRAPALPVIWQYRAVFAAMARAECVQVYAPSGAHVVDQRAPRLPGLFCVIPSPDPR